MLRVGIEVGFGVVTAVEHASEGEEGGSGADDRTGGQVENLLSRETRPLRLEIMVLTLEESTSGLTLKRTTCSMVDDDDDMADLTEKEDLSLGSRLGGEKVRENVLDSRGRPPRPLYI